MKRLVSYRTLRAAFAAVGIDIGRSEDWVAFWRAASANVRPAPR